MEKMIRTKMPWSGTDDIFALPAPILPGANYSEEPHLLRGHSAYSPVIWFFSKTLTSEDPFFIRLAYTVFTREERAIDGGQVVGWSGEAAFEGARTTHSSQDLQSAEVLAYSAVVGGHGFDIDYSLRRLTLPSIQAEDMIDLWNKYRDLCAWVVYIWGGAGDVPAEFADAVVAKVGQLRRESQRLRMGRPQSAGPEKLFNLAEDRKRQRAGEPSWVEDPRPFFFGTLIRQLYDVIDKAGASLRRCGNCDRFFCHQNNRQRFCSDQCRSAYGMRNARARKAKTQESTR